MKTKGKTNKEIPLETIKILVAVEDLLKSWLWLFLFLLKKPKLLLLIAVIGSIWYFMGDGCSLAPVAENSEQQHSDLTRGADLDPDEFDKAEVFEPLA